MTNRTTIPVTITSDFICPWCFIAERRLSEVADKVGVNLDITYKPYELNPSMPKAGKDRQLYRSGKFGSLEKSHELDLGTIAASKDDPLTFDYHKMDKTPNTRLAHRVVQFVQTYAPTLEAKVVDVLFEGYFSLGKDIGDTQTVLVLAESVGVDNNALSQFLSSNDGIDELDVALKATMSSGARGVPSLNFAGGTLSESIYGAQPFAVMEALLTTLKASAINNA